MTDRLPPNRPGRYIGLTGGIACGKSTVADAFAARGVPIIDTDLISRQVVTPPSPYLAQLVDALGAHIVQPDGTLDRAALRALIFADPLSKKTVESILHPAIRQQAQAAAQQAAATHPLVLVVIPLLAEPGVAEHYPWLDRVLGVRCTPALQRQRLRARPGMDDAMTDQMIAAQVTDAVRESLVTDWLDNTGSRESLMQQVAALHPLLLL